MININIVIGKYLVMIILICNSNSSYMSYVLNIFFRPEYQTVFHNNIRQNVYNTSSYIIKLYYYSVFEKNKINRKCRNSYTVYRCFRRYDAVTNFLDDFCRRWRSLWLSRSPFVTVRRRIVYGTQCTCCSRSPAPNRRIQCIIGTAGMRQIGPVDCCAIHTRVWLILFSTSFEKPQTHPQTMIIIIIIIGFSPGPLVFFAIHRVSRIIAVFITTAKSRFVFYNHTFLK